MYARVECVLTPKENRACGRPGQRGRRGLGCGFCQEPPKLLGELVPEAEGAALLRGESQSRGQGGISPQQGDPGPRAAEWARSVHGLEVERKHPSLPGSRHCSERAAGKYIRRETKRKPDLGCWGAPAQVQTGQGPGTPSSGPPSSRPGRQLQNSQVGRSQVRDRPAASTSGPDAGLGTSLRGTLREVPAAEGPASC